MAKDKVQMPSSMGGLVRYFDEYKSKIEFKPGHIIILWIVVIVIMVILHAYGGNWIGWKHVPRYESTDDEAGYEKDGY